MRGGNDDDDMEMLILSMIYVLQLMGGELYHYHSKIMKKEAQSGGRIVWHQDYG